MKRTIATLTIATVALVGGAATANAKGNAWDTAPTTITR